MSAANGRGKGGRQVAAAARSEKDAKPKSITFGGIKFNLPPLLPDTILFDMADIEAAGDNPMPMFRMLRSILGPEQFSQLRGAVEGGKIKAGELDELIEKLFGKYGVKAGESSASPAS